MPDGRASRGTNRAGPRRACNRVKGGHGAFPNSRIPVQYPEHSEFRGVLARSTSVPAGGPGGRKHHGELAHTRGMTERRTRKIQKENSFGLRSIGVIRSKIKRGQQGTQAGFRRRSGRLARGSSIRHVSLGWSGGRRQTHRLDWLHREHRDTLKVHPRSDPKRRLTGVFATRSPAEFSVSGSRMVPWSVAFDAQGGDDDAVDAGSVPGGIGVGEHDGIRTVAQVYR